MRKLLYCILVVIFISLSSIRATAVESHFDKFGGWTGLKGVKTGVFHLEQINSKWWIITPEGNAFWSMGIYCVRIGGIPDKDTGKRPYQDACIAKYGNETEWARVTRLRLNQWGFNTIGDWSSESIYHEPGFAYVIGIDLTEKAENVISKDSYGYFPDVFSQEFRTTTREKIEEVFKHRPYLPDDPWLLGYFLADEPSWYGSKGKRGSLTDDFIRLGPEKAGKIAWVEFIKSRYKNITELNKTWSANFKSYNDLLSIMEIKNELGIEADKLAFLELIAGEFAQVLTAALREFDKKHLILGTRPSRLYPEVLRGLGEYCDIFSAGYYSLNRGYTISKKFDETINEVYKYTKKPVLLGVLIAAQDAGLPYGNVRTQKDRGTSYWKYLARIAVSPVVVGVHWYQYFDPPLHCFDDKAANWGLVNDKDEPYEEAVQLIAQANKMVYAYAMGLTEVAPDFDGVLGSGRSETERVEVGKIKQIPLQIMNPGFEAGGKNWSMQTWKGKSKASIDYFQKHSGMTSLKIRGGSDEGWKSVGVGAQSNPRFVLKPDHEYRLAAWIKVKDVENTAFVRIKLKYKSGDSAYFGTEGLYGTDDWKQVEVKFSPREENTLEYLGAQLVGKGTAWFDDITLELLE